MLFRLVFVSWMVTISALRPDQDSLAELVAMDDDDSVEAPAEEPLASGVDEGDQAGADGGGDPDPTADSGDTENESENGQPPTEEAGADGGGDPDPTADSGDTENESENGQPPTEEVVLPQIVLRIQQDPLLAYTILSTAVNAVSQAFEAFKEGDVVEGLRALQLNLWKVLENVVDPEVKESQEMQDAKVVWDAAFDEAPGTLQLIENFAATGNETALKEAIDSLVGTAADTAANTEAFSNYTSIFRAVSDLTHGLTNSWVLLAEGNTQEALSAAYDALNSSIADLTSDPFIQQNENFTSIMESLDAVCSTLLGNVMKFSIQLQSSSVCYRRSSTPRKVRGSLCAEGFVFDGESLCRPDIFHGADCFRSCGEREGPCDSFCGPGRYCCKKSNTADENCRYARFVDLKFTNSNAEDYFQCVTPTVPVLAQKSEEGEEEAKANDTVKGSAYSATADADTFAVEAMARRSASSLHQAGGRKEAAAALLMDRALARKEGEGGQQRTAGISAAGSHSPWCNNSLGRPEESDDGWCVDKCARGFSQVKEEGKDEKCLQDCQVPFPKDGMFGPHAKLEIPVCGRSVVDINFANSQLLGIAANTVQKIGDAVKALRSEAGIQVDVIASTINAIADLGAHITRPLCDFEEEDAAAEGE